MVSVHHESQLSANGYDGIILIASSIEELDGEFSCFHGPLKDQQYIDNSVSSSGTCIKIAHPSGRLLFFPTGPIDRDYDDVRRYYDASHSAIERALKAGWKKPLLVVKPSKKFPNSPFIALLGALHKLYIPLEIREDVPERKKLEKLGVYGNSKMIELAQSIEAGRCVARDIGGSDPERMTPHRVEEYVLKTFLDVPDIKIEVISDDTSLLKEYPLYSAVNRCAKGVERHRGRIIYLTYEGKGPIRQTLHLVGKGVTYDTGGADIKAGGVMAGMHRDKCGAAAVAGFMQIVAKLKPPNLKVISGLAMVRNSVGSDCYVADEIITSRAGVRVRVRNTDAEGRMAMADVLCNMKEKALSEVNPHLMTIATLTGHAVLALGDYTAIMDNGPAHLEQTARRVQEAGEQIADPCEVSTLRREDYDFIKGLCEYEDIVQSNDEPSTKTKRGHQFPAAFLICASGLDKHGKNSARPIKYSHMDIAGSGASYPCLPTAAPIMALAKTFMPDYFVGLKDNFGF